MHAHHEAERLLKTVVEMGYLGAAARIAALEAALRPFADYADHVPNDCEYVVARREYADGTFGALYADEFLAAREALKSDQR